MVLGALHGIALRSEDLSEIIDELKLNVKINVKEVVKQGIAATRVDVKELERTERSLSDVISLLESSTFDEKIKKDAINIFQILGEAESRVHGGSLKNMHFHEIGSDDAILDIVGSCVGFNRLFKKGYKMVFSTPLVTGHGYATSAHGNFPVPAPAVIEILKTSDLQIKKGDFDVELLTPTGAAILTYFSKNMHPEVNFRVHEVSYGAGSYELPIPNVLRIMLGEVEDLLHDDVRVIETNVDDVDGEILGHLISKLTEQSLDVSVIPLVTKKNRPGHLIRVVATIDQQHDIIETVFKETGSLGVRILPVHHRFKVPRDVKTIKLSIGSKEYKARIKIWDYQGRKYVSGEYEDAARISRDTGLPLKEIMFLLELEARRSLNE